LQLARKPQQNVLYLGRSSVSIANWGQSIKFVRRESAIAIFSSRHSIRSFIWLCWASQWSRAV